MEPSRTICFWVTFICISVFSTFSDSHANSNFKKSSFYHKKWLMVNLTCFDTENDSEITKRSISTYKEVKNQVPIQQDTNLDETLSSNGYESSDNYSVNTYLVHNTKNVAKNSKKANEAHGSSVHQGHKSEDHFASSDRLDQVILSNSSKQVEMNNTVKVSTDINCDYLELDTDVVETSAKHLKVSSSGILNITSEWATNATDLVYLKITSDKGITIPEDCSWLPPSLHTLDLSYTPLHSILFRQCPHSLNRLSLQGTSLEELSICLKPLQELDASWNMLLGSGIKLECKEAAKNLKELKLHNNQLTFWSSCGFPSLANLELQNNEISNISFSECQIRELFRLNLSKNKFVEPPSTYPPKLTSINLSHNLLRKTSHFNRVVQEIDLSYNFLTAIAHGTFRTTSRLLSLDLSHNQLTVIHGHDFAGCTALRQLDLSHNALTHIRNEAFLPLRYILSLKIDHNYLHRLDARLLAGLPKKLQFQANSNPWRCSCHLLAAIKKASRAHCKPECHDLHKLTCREHAAEVLIDVVLRQCIEAVQGFDPSQTVHMLPHEGSSDEDTSEEKLTPSSQHLYTAIPLTILVLIGLPLLVLGTRKLYRKRNSFKNCCSCLAPSSATNDRQYSAQQMQDTDSETEF